MDKLNQLLSGNALDFAAAFGAATRAQREDPPPSGFPLRLERWVIPASGGFIEGEGKLHYRGRTCRFYFSIPPLQQVEGTGVSCAGTVSRLYRLADFSGTYSRSNIESMPMRGGAAYLANEHGVVIEFCAPARYRPCNFPHDLLGVRLAMQP